MPLTKFQQEIASLLAANRTEDSYLAGGAALHIAPNSQRLSSCRQLKTPKSECSFIQSILLDVEPSETEVEWRFVWGALGGAHQGIDHPGHGIGQVLEHEERGHDQKRKTENEENASRHPHRQPDQTDRCRPPQCGLPGLLEKWNHGHPVASRGFGLANATSMV